MLVPLEIGTAPICRTAAHSCPGGPHPRGAGGKIAFGTPGWLVRRFRKSPPRVRVPSAPEPTGIGSLSHLQQSASSFGLLRNACLTSRLPRTILARSSSAPLCPLDFCCQSSGETAGRLVRPLSCCTGASLLVGWRQRMRDCVSIQDTASQKYPCFVCDLLKCPCATSSSSFLNRDTR